MSKNTAREPSPEQETQARRDDGTGKWLDAILNSREPEQETQARSGEDSALIKTLLGTRDLSKRIDHDDLMALALLASRALDDLD